MDSPRVWAEIDLDAFEHNLGVIRRKAGPGVALLLVAKADAYGHGAVAIAHHAVRCGVEALGVGTSAEALELRHAGVRARIVVLGTIVDGETDEVLRHDVEIGVHSSDRLKRLELVARQRGAVARVHLNVDTGMGLLGVLPQRAPALLRQIHAAEHLELAGVMTHVTAIEGAHAASTAEQMRRFEEVLSVARAEGLLRGWVHVASSASLFSDLRPLGDAVRPGLAAYGALPAPLAGWDELRPVLSLRSQVVFMKDLPRGTALGYAGSWVAPRATRIATLPVGYDDGVSLRLSNRGAVLVRGARVPIVGRVTMDYTTVDVTDVPGVRAGDQVTLIGRDAGECLRVEDVARAADSIPYELLCSVGKRVQRVYRGGERARRPVAGSAAPPRAAAVEERAARLPTAARLP